MKKNKMLRVNLSTGNIDSVPLSEDLENNFMGGEGLGTRLVWDMVPPKADPLGPNNAIVFASGYIKVHQMAKVGIILNLIAVVLLIFVFQYIIPIMF